MMKSFIQIWTLLIGLFLLHIPALFSQIFPALPQTENVITCFPDTAGYTVITVGPVDRDYTDLQEAINDATPGTILILDAGASFYGGFELPDKGAGDKWIILMSSRMDLLPADENRIDPLAPTNNAGFPTQRDAMPKLITNHPSGIPTIKTHDRSHHYRLVGIEVGADVSVLKSYGLINLGSTAQNSIDVVPHHFIIDRCYIHGHTNATIMKYGVRLDCANAAIVDSYIADFHSIGFDAQAISGINGPGPFKILNNYLEASGENILFGGGTPAIPGLVPSDIEIRQNYFYKPFSWREGHPDYAGKHWTIKNLFELKTGKRVLLDGNILENCWSDLPVGQSGYAILLTIRTENGNAPQADVSDIVISNNIIKHVGAGISLSGSDDGEGLRSSRIQILNNLFIDVNGPAYGDQNHAGPNDGTFLKIGKPKDVWIDHNSIFQTGPITWAYDVTDNFIFTNNIAQSYISTGGYQGIYGPGQSQGNNTIAHYFPDISDANKHLNKNVFIGGNMSKYTNYNTVSENYFPPDVGAVEFVDYDNGFSDYHHYALANSSPYKQAAENGKDPGVNYNTLDSALTAQRNCPLILGYQSNDRIPEIEIFPNPVNEVLYVALMEGAQANYAVIDIHGRTILSGKMNVSTEINTDALLPGPYFLRVIVGRSSVNQLFIAH